MPLSRSEREGALLAQIVLAVVRTDNVLLAVEETLRSICQATGWLLGEAWVPHSTDGGEPVLRYYGNWTNERGPLETFTMQASGLRFRKGEGVPGAAWVSGRPLWIDDLQTSQQFTRAALAAGARLRAAVAIPLMYADDDVVAVLEFFLRDVPADNAQLVQLASAVAKPLAQVLRQKQIEEAHRLAEARFIGMVSIASDAIISIDSARRITMFNWGAERIFGYSEAEAIGQLLDILLPEDLRSRHAAHITGFATSPDTTRRMGERSRIVGLRKNGEVFPAEASISRFLAGGEWVYTVILRDVSDRVRTEEELRVLAERMRKAAASRDEVMALVSHDLRNPLSTISMCLSGLQDDPPPTAEMAGQLVTLANESVLLMSRMIQDLLDIASIDAGRLSIERTMQPIGPILERAIEMHRLIAADQDIALIDDISTTVHRVSVNADGERIVQVLSNLIGNACKFTGGGGRVTVSAHTLPDAVQITVRDTGRGISVDAIPHIFDRFWYARQGAAQRSTGLGLAIARGIVEAHEGRIWVESTLGEGSVFHFTLPSAPSSAKG
jgi:PAS domain S-box-containing protein